MRFDARLTPDEGARLLGLGRGRGRPAGRRGPTGRGRRARAGRWPPTPWSDWPAVAGAGTDARRPVPAARDRADAVAVRQAVRDRARRAVVHVRVDHAALVRGRVEGDELCEIPGVGPIPVEVARRLAVDSILNVLVTDGVDVTRSPGPAAPSRPRCAGRWSSATRSAWSPGATPATAWRSTTSCPFADGGEASLANLARLCHWHHYLKTHHGHRLERTGRDDGSVTPAGGGGSPPTTHRWSRRRIRRSG